MARILCAASILAISVGAAAFFAVMAVAAEPDPFAALVSGAKARVVEVVDGDTVVLERAVDGARQVRLVGLQAPKLPLGRRGFKPWPLGEDSRLALEALSLGRTVELAFGGARMDRHGRLLAHLFDVESGTWIQGAMLARGMARVYSFPDNRALVGEMLAREREARAAGRGIWDHPYYAVRTPAETAALIDSFQVVEGTVVDAARVRTTVYLNFGANWRTDFTVSVRGRARWLFEESGIDLLALEGRRIRVRGWLRSYNGPLIEASHPEQIEILYDR